MDHYLKIPHHHRARLMDVRPRHRRLLERIAVAGIFLAVLIAGTFVGIVLAQSLPLLIALFRRAPILIALSLLFFLWSFLYLCFAKLD